MSTNLKKYAIGIDIGGTGTKIGIVDPQGKIISQSKIATKDYTEIQAFVDALYENLEKPIQEIGGFDNVIGIGMGAPNGNYYTGTIEYAPNLPWKGKINIADLVTEKFGIPAYLTNDANAAAVGEMTYGVARGITDFIMITLGTGVGSGIVIDGKIVYGSDGFAGELGHNIIIPGGRPHWSTGAKGSLETYASATGLSITAREVLAKYPDEESLLREFDPEKITSKEVFECAEKGDRLSKEIFDFTGNILGLALANFIMFSSPSAIVLFGGVMNAGDYILKPTKASMEENLLPIYRNKVHLLISELEASDAAILGASALVWDRQKKA